MDKYGFYGGCFNPPTLAHIELAQNAIKKYKLDKLFIVPVGKHYKKENLASEEQRLEMLKLAIRGCEKIEILPIELNQNKNFTASEIFGIIEQKYSNSENYFIMGADNFANLDKWNNSEVLIQKFKYIILERPGYDIKKIIAQTPKLKTFRKNFNVLENKENAISSTYVRQLLQQGKYDELDNYIPQEVKKYLLKKSIIA